MKFVFASSNPSKTREAREILGDKFELINQSDYGISAAEEIASTFLENALIKARHASFLTGLPAIADDSGLCVDILGGAPGVKSARYSGSQSNDKQNIRKLLDELGDQTNRKAFFVCVIVALNHPEDPTPITLESRWEGEIATKALGNKGFGYDSVFLIPGLNRTAGQLARNEKNAISHRGKALKGLMEELSERYSS